VEIDSKQAGLFVRLQIFPASLVFLGISNGAPPAVIKLYVRVRIRACSNNPLDSLINIEGNKSHAASFAVEDLNIKGMVKN
jgi:hypothetical protein